VGVEPTYCGFQPDYSIIQRLLCSPPPEPFGHPGLSVREYLTPLLSYFVFGECTGYSDRIQGNFGVSAPVGQASTHSKQSVHSGSLNFSHGRSSIRICMGQASTHPPHLVHFEGSRFIPRKLKRMNIDIRAPVGQRYLHQNQGTR
jgi:hypothetical protein